MFVLSTFVHENAHTNWLEQAPMGNQLLHHLFDQSFVIKSKMVAILKRICSLHLVNFMSGLFSKIKLIAISTASDNGIFVNKLVGSKEIKNLSCTITD